MDVQSRKHFLNKCVFLSFGGVKGMTKVAETSSLVVSQSQSFLLRKESVAVRPRPKKFSRAVSKTQTNAADFVKNVKVTDVNAVAGKSTI